MLSLLACNYLFVFVSTKCTAKQSGLKLKLHCIALLSTASAKGGKQLKLNLSESRDSVTQTTKSNLIQIACTYSQSQYVVTTLPNCNQIFLHLDSNLIYIPLKSWSPGWVMPMLIHIHDGTSVTTCRGDACSGRPSCTSTSPFCLILMNDRDVIRRSGKL